MGFCSLCVVCVWVGTASVCATPSDGFASIAAESQWFVPQHHSTEIVDYIAGWSGSRTLHALELFGRTRSVQRVWEQHGFRADALDIRLGGSAHDILSRAGWFCWLDKMLQLKDRAILVAEPPSWWWVWRRSGMRHGVYGDRSSFQQRLALAIAKNFASLLEHIHGARRLYYVIVQPADSNLLRTEEFRYLQNLLLLASVTTWLGLFGHVVDGRITVLTNLRGHRLLKRRMTHHRRQGIRLRREQAMLNRESFDRRVAAYPRAFCCKLLELWSILLTSPVANLLPSLVPDPPASDQQVQEARAGGRVQDQAEKPTLKDSQAHSPHDPPVWDESIPVLSF